MVNTIEVNHLTKDYGKQKGIFDISFSIPKGEVFGFLGPNGAGKTTTIRHLMGFLKPDSGDAQILGMDCFQHHAEIQKKLGYLPGEISFMDDMTGDAFLSFMMQLKGVSNPRRVQELTEILEFQPSGKIRKMSKGMKQKLGIICTMMQEPEILLLDEPTSGLDPLMQNRFIDLLLEEKKKGTTIFLSSHIFEEIERTCDRAAFIRDGKLIAVEQMEQMRQNRQRIFLLEFYDNQESHRYLSNHPQALAQQQNTVVEVKISGTMDAFIKDLSGYQLKDMQMRTQTLEELFLHFYGGNHHE